MVVIFLVSYSDDQKRQIIMDHYLNPRFKNDQLVIDETKMVYQHSSACVDEIWLDYQNQKFSYQAKGCAIFISACDIFIERLVEIGIEQKEQLVKLFQNLVNQDQILTEQEKVLLGKLNIYENVKRHLNRVECALWITKIMMNF